MKRLLALALLAYAAATTAFAEPKIAALVRATPRAGAITTRDAAGALDLTNLTASGTVRTPSITYSSYPLTWNSPLGVFMYATEGVYAIPSNPYYDNLAIGEGTLNAVTHSSMYCTSPSPPFTAFCGDEVAFGDYTLWHDVRGHDNTAIGDHALAQVVKGVQNTFVGSSAGANITGDNNTGLGTSACQNVTATAGTVVCIGLSALQNAGSTSANVIAIGTQTAITTTVAQSLVAVGDGAGYNATSDTDSVLIGRNACSNGKTITNSICIGEGGPAPGTYSNLLWIGGGTNPPIQGNLATNAVTLPGTVTVGGGLITPPVAYASLPASPALGQRGAVNNTSVCAFNTAVNGSGALFCPVIYTGSAWVGG